MKCLMRLYGKNIWEDENYLLERQLLVTYVEVKVFELVDVDAKIYSFYQ
jgi:hypothetical protein